MKIINEPIVKAWNEPVLVIWHDHYGHEGDDEWTTPTEPEELKPVVVRSVGFIVAENDDMIELARDGYMNDGELTIGGPLRVLRKCIVSLTYLAA